MKDELRIVIISSLEEAAFVQKFLTGIIAVSFNRSYTAFSPDPKTAFVYSTKPLWSAIVKIFQDSSITKLISKPSPALKSFLGGVTCNKCQHISDYMSHKGDNRSIPEMKREIVEQDKIHDLKDRTGSIALIIMEYKTNADIVANNPKKEKKSLFNKRRDCYLLYLTAFNDILIRNGPLPFMRLVNIVKSYPYLCRVGINPSVALEGLIKVGALSSDRFSTIVSIPDQLP
jgi:hypothetical protein